MKKVVSLRLHYHSGFHLVVQIFFQKNFTVWRISYRYRGSTTFFPMGLYKFFLLGIIQTNNIWCNPKEKGSLSTIKKPNFYKIHRACKYYNNNNQFHSRVWDAKYPIDQNLLILAIDSDTQLTSRPQFRVGNTFPPSLATSNFNTFPLKSTIPYSSRPTHTHNIGIFSANILIHLYNTSCSMKMVGLGTH